MHIHIHHIHTSNKNIPTTHTLTPTGLPSDPSSHPPSLIRQVSIGSGGYHTLALTRRGDVYAWGHHRVHQLGPVDNSLLLRNEGN